MVLIETDDSVLVENRVKQDWPGITFPGGHVEPNESFVESAIREVKEETGLTVSNLTLSGVCQYPDQQDEQAFRRVIFFYRTRDFKGKLRGSREGNVFWMKKNDFRQHQLAGSLNDFLKIYRDNTHSELIYRQDDARNWHPFYY